VLMPTFHAGPTVTIHDGTPTGKRENVAAAPSNSAPIRREQAPAVVLLRPWSIADPVAIKTSSRQPWSCSSSNNSGEADSNLRPPPSPPSDVGYYSRVDRPTSKESFEGSRQDDDDDDYEDYISWQHRTLRQPPSPSSHTFRRRSTSRTSLSVFRLASPTLPALPEEPENDDDEEPLLSLQNVTEQSRSLIPLEVWNKHHLRHTLTMTSSSVQSEPKTKKSLRKRLVSSLKKKEDKNDEEGTEEPFTETLLLAQTESSDERSDRSDRKQDRRRSKSETDHVDDASSTKGKAKRLAGGVVRRMRSLSRSRSRSSSNKEEDPDRPKTIVTVTSCRSDGYYNQKAPGSTSKLPRKAPTNLKLFHELAVGIKDAYAAVGKTPNKPVQEDEETGEKMDTREFVARSVLWEFIGNIDFVSKTLGWTDGWIAGLVGAQCWKILLLTDDSSSFFFLKLLALVDEVAVDTATRGALKDDTTFKGLRDVIKKCNKVLEDMLVRRERRYTLFFRLVQTEDTKDIERIKSWNEKVEKAVGAVTDSQSDKEGTDHTDSESDASSIASASTAGSSKGSILSRGRQLLPVAGRVRARRATPTPTLRRRSKDLNKENDKDGNAAEDGFSASAPVTSGNLAALQQSFQNKNSNQGPIPSGLVVKDDGRPQLAPAQQIQPKDELVDVIRGLRMEKMKNREGTQEDDLAALKPDWRPKADIPSAVPKLPTEYIHRHRLMKQVVSCLLDQSGAGPRDVDEESTDTAVITSITSRHGDKAGNGKTILAVAAIQTVEVRERFSDGIAWIRLGRGPLSERDIRRLYEELYRQIIVKDSDIDVDDYDDDKIDEIPSRGSSSFEGRESRNASNERKQSSKEETDKQRLATLAVGRRRFQGGELEGIKEEVGRLLAKKKVLICLDDVWRVEDAKWFIFDNMMLNGAKQKNKKKRESAAEEYPCRVLMTTRTPSLMGQGIVQEVFVRILSEHEAVKLLLSTAGRRPYGGKNSAVFNQAKLIVKGCGNSPLAVRLAGSMLRHSSRSWNINSPAWSSLIHQCRLNLEEASQLRSFINAVNRVVDLSFFTVSDVRTRIALRRCFVAFAMAFRDNDWLLSGKGIPQSVVLRVFKTIISADEANKYISASSILSMLEKLNLIERARHGWHTRGTINPVREALIKKESTRSSGELDSDWDDEDEDEGKIYRVQQLFVMHDSVRMEKRLFLPCFRISPFLTICICKFTAQGGCGRNGETIHTDTITRPG
jgi:hypothetical protein